MYNSYIIQSLGFLGLIELAVSHYWSVVNCTIDLNSYTSSVSVITDSLITDQYIANQCIKYVYWTYISYDKKMLYAFICHVRIYRM